MVAPKVKKERKTKETKIAPIANQTLSSSISYCKVSHYAIGPE